MKKYIILWLDDEFAGNTEFGYDVDSYVQNQDEFAIKKVSNYAEFEYEIEHYSRKYDGVILDIFGDKTAEQTKGTNTSEPFYMALELIRTEKFIKIAFSGKVTGSTEQGSLQYMAKKYHIRLIDKSDKDIEELFDTVVKPMLEDKFCRDFPEYDEIKKLLSNEVKSRFDKVRALYNENVDKSEPFKESDFEDIRKLIEAVFRVDASDKKIIRHKNTLGECLDQLGTKCQNKFIQPAFDIIRKLSNPESHFNKAKVVDYPGYGKYVYLALYNELFMCLKWYYCDLVPNLKTKDTTTTREDVTTNSDGTIEIGDGEIHEDKDLKVLYMGNMQICKPAKVGWKVEVDFKLDNVISNEHHKDKYPWFAYWKRL